MWVVGSVFSSGQESCFLFGAMVQGRVWGRSQEVLWADQGSARDWGDRGVTVGGQEGSKPRHGGEQRSEETGGDLPASQSPHTQPEKELGGVVPARCFCPFPREGN